MKLINNSSVQINDYIYSLKEYYQNMIFKNVTNIPKPEYVFEFTISNSTQTYFSSGYFNFHELILLINKLWLFDTFYRDTLDEYYEEIMFPIQNDLVRRCIMVSTEQLDSISPSESDFPEYLYLTGSILVSGATILNSTQNPYINRIICVKQLISLYNLEDIISMLYSSVASIPDVFDDTLYDDKFPLNYKTF